MLTLDKAGNLLAGRWLLLVMLGVLHGAVMLGVNNPWAPPLLLAHLGLFLLWQPLWRGEHAVGVSGLAYIVLAAVVVVFWLNWWVVAFWLTGLFGLVGARIFAFHDRWARLIYLSVMVYLLAALLLWVVPNLFGAQSAIEAGHIVMRYVLSILLVSVLVLDMARHTVSPASDEPVESVRTVDFIYSLLLFMLLALVVLGSLAFMTLARLDYLEALLRTLLLMGLVLLALGGLWSPRFGFGGLQAVFSRYLLNVGTPFEDWLGRLAEAAQHEPDPASYLRRATALLADFPWLSGLSWQSPDGAGQSGQASGHKVSVQEGELHLTVYARQSPNPAVLLHVYLLTQLIGYFYQAKQREQSLRDITHLQAVYETGSRLTHDLKNMLQSLLALAALAQNEGRQAQPLLQQQLPLLAQRIESALNKLRRPQDEGEVQLLDLAAWWDTLQLRNRHHEIDWEVRGPLSGRKIHVALFDCVLDNLLDNALKKRQKHPDVRITVTLYPEPFHITVCDSGETIPEVVATSLMRYVVASESGLGIGLYQAARWAEQLDYHLTLASNRTGRICFNFGDSGSR